MKLHLLSDPSRRKLEVGARLEVGAQLHQVGHVDLVEGGQHRVRVLGALQALRHARAQPRHLHPPATQAFTEKESPAGRVCCCVQNVQHACTSSACVNSGMHSSNMHIACAGLHSTVLKRDHMCGATHQLQDRQSPLRPLAAGGHRRHGRCLHGRMTRSSLKHCSTQATPRGS